MSETPQDPSVTRRLVMARLEAVLADNFTDDNGRTHFEECWRAHAPCAIRKAHDLLAARAATEARHQQEIATLTAERDREHQIREQAESDLMAQIDNSVALAATVQRVEAERDAKSRLIAELEGEAKDLKYHPISGIYAIEAERDRLKAALQDVTIGMDRAGGDRDGMPECPWCQSQGRPEDAEEGYAHDVDCSLMMARAALTPQGQSTDGETR